MTKKKIQTYSASFKTTLLFWADTQHCNCKNIITPLSVLQGEGEEWGYMMSRNLLGNIQRSEQMIIVITESRSSQSGRSVNVRGKSSTNNCFVLTAVTNVWHAEIHMAFNLSQLYNSY